MPAFLQFLARDDENENVGVRWKKEGLKRRLRYENIFDL